MHVEREVEDDVPVVRLYNRKWWYAAASLLVLCAFAFTMVWQNGRKLSDDAIFSEFYNSANVIDQTRGGQDLVEAVVRFQQKDFSEASLLFKSILEKDKSNIAAQFYYGISNIETKHYDNAINAFNTIINQNDNLYVEHAEWFLGLCYLKNNQHDKAVRQFKTVAVNPDNFHRQEAVALLKNILGK
jgi:tetratricopeptide (TPR) repeat protein